MTPSSASLAERSGRMSEGLPCLPDKMSEVLPDKMLEDSLGGDHSTWGSLVMSEATHDGDHLK